MKCFFGLSWVRLFISWSANFFFEKDKSRFCKVSSFFKCSETISFTYVEEGRPRILAAVSILDFNS